LEKKLNYLIDSRILIDHLRGNKNTDFLKKDKRNHLKISIITMMELILGARKKNDISNMNVSDFKFIHGISLKPMTGVLL
jgi:predicted nucleic acid-binding protein